MGYNELMRVLIACECSNTVRDAFLKRGHDVYSCDLQRADHPNKNFRRHIQGDVRPLLRKRWDLVIAHPPCTYLCNSGVRWMSSDPTRHDLMMSAVKFFLDCLNANSPSICVENPRQYGYAREMIGIEYTQEIQPYEFGDPYRKSTRLWLEGLLPLVPTKRVKPVANWVNGDAKGKGMHTNPKLRAKTFQGIADAMAEQWG